MRFEELERANQRALDRRPFKDPDYQFRPISAHDRRLHQLKRKYPYFGYVEVSVENVRPFLMLSNNDDLVAQIYFWYGPDSYETTSMRIWRRLVRLHRFVVDVGSYSGVYGLVAATANPDAVIVAIEPMREVFRRLLDNLAVNRLGKRVRTIRCALGDRDGEGILYDFHKSPTLSTGSSVVEKDGKQVRDREQISVRRYDSLLKDGMIAPPDVIKLDVEQGEVAAIRGMQKTLAQHRPKMIVEVSGRESLNGLIEILSPLGYNFAAIDDLASTVIINDESQLAEKVANVLFIAARPDRIRSFCSPLATGYIA